MLIRSQNRTCIVVLNSIAALAIRQNKSFDKFDIVALTPSGSSSCYATTTIDTYSTEAKALKVMDMIEEQYKTHNSKQGWMEMVRSGMVEVNPESFLDVWNATMNTSVFQMPADEEVEA